MRRLFAWLGTTGVALVCACGGSDGAGVPAGDDAGTDAANDAGGGGGGGDGGGGGGGDAADGATACTDKDKDGQTTCAGDCNDNDPSIFSGNTEICGDAKDNDCDGVVDKGCNGLGTFVSSAIGDDTNPGTTKKPVKTIAKGMANAATIGGAQSVVVAAGHYSEKVTLAEGVNLLGGYRCDAVATCDWTRDVKANDTAILNIDFEGVLAGPTVTSKTRLDGFRIAGLTGVPPMPGTAAITVKGGTPTITGNRIAGGDVTGGAQRSVGVAIVAAPNAPGGATIDGNDITSGSEPVGVSAAILMLQSVGGAASVAAQITRNRIRAGTALGSYGIAAATTVASTLVQDNDILAGTSPNGGSFGIVAVSALTIDRNRINTDQVNVGGCAGAGFCGGILTQSATVTITNNVVFGVKSSKSAAIFLTEAETPAGIAIVNGNYLDGAGSGPAAGAGTISAAVALRIGGCPACGVNAVFGRLRNNILVGGDNQKRFGLYEEEVAGKTNHAEALANNDFWFAPAAGRIDAAVHSWDGAVATDYTFALLAGLAAPVATASISADPRVNATFHLSTAPASPCINAGTATEAPAKDMDGDSRPKGAAIDIGPDEAQ